jgi:hypothetical protein
MRIAAFDFPVWACDDGASMLASSRCRVPLVGRSAGLEALTGLLDDVERAGAALVVRGDPGIGKSRLAPRLRA